jgi:hypothetical protein
MRCGLMRGRSLHRPWPSSISPPGSKVCTDSQMPFLLVCNFQLVSCVVTYHASYSGVGPPVVAWQVNIGALIINIMAGCVCCMNQY